MPKIVKMAKNGRETGSIAELQERLLRISQDLDWVAQCLYERSFERDWNLIERAIDDVGEVANGFLESSVLDGLPTDGRPRPACGEGKTPIPIKARKHRAA